MISLRPQYKNSVFFFFFAFYLHHSKCYQYLLTLLKFQILGHPKIKADINLIEKKI